MVNVGPIAPAGPRRLAVPAELTDDDRAWVREQATLAGATLETDRPGRPPVDTSWVTMTEIRG